MVMRCPELSFDLSPKRDDDDRGEAEKERGSVVRSLGTLLLNLLRAVPQPDQHDELI
jgi:hypothetical protein